VKTTKPIIGFLLVVLAGLSAHAEGTLQDLNFEEANPMPVPGTPYVTEVSALPSWTVTIGGVQQTEISENDPSTGAPWVMLVGPGDSSGFAPIDGNYSVLLQGSFFSSVPAISQTALIPADTESLLFEAQAGSGNLAVMVGTQTIPFIQMGTGPNYTLYGADVSAWAGDTEQITFSALEAVSSQNNWELDDISFSAVPEPSMVALSAMGGLFFGARKWLARRHCPVRD
jgi:hypothetical protein